MDNFMGKQWAADLYRIPLALSDGTLTDFSQFRGKVVLVVNVAAGFCQRNFGMTFPFTLKADVRGKNQHPLYPELTRFRTGLLPGPVKWNFEKFLVSRDGQVVNRFAPAVEADSAVVIGAVEVALC